MRVMIRFTKDPVIRYVSHLDLMRSARRHFRRADLPVAYSEGYHPHPILSFAMALPVGASSDGEYMDLGLAVDMPCSRIMEQMNAVCPLGMKITGVWTMDEEAPSQMAMVTAARWRLTFNGDAAEILARRVPEILNAQSVTVEKNNGKKISIVDIRPGIHTLSLEEDGMTVNALLDAGSKNNIQPQNLADALLGEPSLGKVLIHRLEVLGDRDGNLVPLEKCRGVRDE